MTRTHAFKGRLSPWGYKKNFKKKDVKAVVEETERGAEQGVALPHAIMIDGRHCDWDRVHRLSGKEYNVLRLQHPSTWQAFLSRASLKTTPAEYNIEFSLRELKDYWAITIAREETRASVRQKRRNAGIQADANDLELRLLGGLSLVEHGQAVQGWQEINHMLDVLVKIIRLQEPSLLFSIIGLFSSKMWMRHHEIYVQVTRYTMAVCDIVLTQGHPLTKILTTFVNLPQTSPLVDDFAELGYQVMVDLVNERPEHVKVDRYYTHCAEAHLLLSMRSRLDRPDVYELLKLKHAHYKRTLGPRSRHTLSALINLAKMYIDDAWKLRSEARSWGEPENEKEANMQQQPAKKKPDPEQWTDLEDKAKAILNQIIEQGHKFANDRSSNAVYSAAVWELGRFYFSVEEYKEVQKYYCKALVWAVERFGLIHIHVSLILKGFRALQRLAALGIDIGVVEEAQGTGNEGRLSSTSEDTQGVGMGEEVIDSSSVDEVEAYAAGNIFPFCPSVDVSDIVMEECGNEPDGTSFDPCLLDFPSAPFDQSMQDLARESVSTNRPAYDHQTSVHVPAAPPGPEDGILFDEYMQATSDESAGGFHEALFGDGMQIDGIEELLG